VKAILLGRPTIETVPGGDALQMHETAEVLRDAGLETHVTRTAAEAETLLEAGDTLNLWNVQRAPDWGGLPELAAERGARVLITPLFHPVERYHREGRTGGAAMVARLLQDADRFAALRWGGGDLKERARVVLEAADSVLVAASAEADLLREWCGADLQRTAIVPPGVPELAPAPMALPFDRDFVLSVGRIEPLKNPLLTLTAATRAKLPIAFAGALPPRGRHLLHSRRFKRELGAAGRAHARWLGALPPAQIRGLARHARVHVLASWTEVLGRSTVEAAMHGAAVVLTDVGHAPDLLGRDDPRVFLVEPGDEDGLVRALQRAWDVGRDPDGPLATRARATLSWRAVTPALLDAWGTAR
jgi:glycosyltransferase involved in cell wall biosynthesis